VTLYADGVQVAAFTLSGTTGSGDVMRIGNEAFIAAGDIESERESATLSSQRVCANSRNRSPLAGRLADLIINIPCGNEGFVPMRMTSPLPVVPDNVNAAT